MKSQTLQKPRFGLLLIALLIIFSINLKAQTVITKTIVLNAHELLPLDKTKPGYYEDKPYGRVIQAGYKKNDQYDGEQREYNDNKQGGEVSAVTMYKDGQMHGFRLEFDWGEDDLGFGAVKKKNGCLYMVRNYREGVLHGPTQSYKCNGKKDGPPKVYDDGNWVDQ